ncbi:peptide-methionine (S)-S-oxide reductase MsrA [Pontiella sulfatireligans]|uniref:Peptide methionine sulfoxide reductase MsrA n=1 Tax=Pontiella sulfatireligans TaxID=2750658 RepID=A0A6C2UN79_9BACT|nr:peptide-methionine (S)-S-oxide reductase MsrA [Pontiella sulfatireligans]VGO21393.1 Peptide methionine sulfoxide reductase MsrA [Pontiella sulfatireligans]
MKRTLFILAMVATVSVAGAEKKETKMDKAVFAAGCFWGVEAVFQELDGVIDTTVGYTGGKTENPTYKEICYKETGHAEAIEIVYDPAKIAYEELLAYFWRLHDPTTMNRQGPDVGTQYRSAVFYYSPEQKATAEKIKADSQKKWKKPIVTEITEGGVFYPAETYHQDYFKNRGVHHTGCHYLRD